MLMSMTKALISFFWAFADGSITSLDPHRQGLHPMINTTADLMISLTLAGGTFLLVPGGLFYSKSVIAKMPHKGYPWRILIMIAFSLRCVETCKPLRRC